MKNHRLKSFVRMKSKTFVIDFRCYIRPIEFDRDIQEKIKWDFENKNQNNFTCIVEIGRSLLFQNYTVKHSQFL